MKCPTCGKPQYGTKQFERFMANLLRLCITNSSIQEVSWREKRDEKHSVIITETLPDIVLSKSIRDAGYATRYARMGDLTYWGLLSQRKEWWHQGIYQITTKAKDFVLGKISIPESVIVSKGSVLSISDIPITYKAACGKQWNEIADWINDWRGKH